MAAVIRAGSAGCAETHELGLLEDYIAHDGRIREGPRDYAGRVAGGLRCLAFLRVFTWGHTTAAQAAGDKECVAVLHELFLGIEDHTARETSAGEIIHVYKSPMLLLLCHWAKFLYNLANFYARQELFHLVAYNILQKAVPNAYADGIECIGLRLVLMELA